MAKSTQQPSPKRIVKQQPKGPTAWDIMQGSRPKGDGSQARDFGKPDRG